MSQLFSTFRQKDMGRCYSIFCFILFLGFGHSAFAQATDELTNYVQTSESMVPEKIGLSKNQSTQALPIADLTNASFVHVRLPKNDDPVHLSFYEYLSKYTKIYTTDNNSNNPDKTLIYSVLCPISKSDSIELLQHLGQQSGTKLVALFGAASPLLTKQIKGRCDGLILSPNTTQLAASIAAQAVFGGANVGPCLGLNIKTICPIEQTRLGYAPPEYVHMDGRKLDSLVSDIIQYGLSEKAFPGAQVLVARRGKIIYHKAWGYHTYDRQRQVRLDDIYDLASITKVSSPLPALMQLSDRGLFDLDAPTTAYWPDFKGTNKEQLTWRQILAHHGRLQPWIPYWQNTLRKKPKRNGWRYKCRTFKPKSSNRYPIRITDSLYLHKNYRKRMFKAIKETPLNDESGYKYSGLAFYLFPTMIAQISGVPYENYLTDSIYLPLGANTLVFNPLKYFDKDRIIPTEVDTFFRMEPIHGTVHDEGAIMMNGVNGNAGLFGTANDLAKLWQMYLNHGTYGNQQYITHRTMDEFTSCAYCPEGNHRGLGFDKPRIDFDPNKAGYSKDASSGLFGHAGYTGTLVWADPKEQLLMIFLSNRVYPTRDNRKLYQLDIRPRLHQALYDSRIR